METLKVNRIDSVSAEILKTNPPSLHIIAKAENTNSNYSNVRLEPRIYITPPADGIWEFDMLGDVPPIVDTIITKVTAEYDWKNLPKDVKGVKVYSATNYKTALNGTEKL